MTLGDETLLQFCLKNYEPGTKDFKRTDFNMS